jgi:hypothetical protein
MTSTYAIIEGRIQKAIDAYLLFPTVTGVGDAFSTTSAAIALARRSVTDPPDQYAPVRDWARLEVLSI